MLNKGITRIILLLSLTLIYACKKKCSCQDPRNPDCANYNPCYGEDKVNTNFKVLRPLDGFPEEAPECRFASYDTIFAGTTIRLQVPGSNPKNSKYEWKIGTDQTIYTKKDFEIDFKDWLNAGNWESNVSITLNVINKPNSCLDINDTLKSETRQIFFTKKNPVFGTFFGNWNGSITNDTFKYFLSTNYAYFRGKYLGFNNTAFYTGAPFVDSFLQYDDINSSLSCKNKNFKKFEPELLTGFLYAKDYELIYFNRIKFTFYVRKPGESDETYTFIGNRIN